jgi:acyl dehydratase
MARVHDWHGAQRDERHRVGVREDAVAGGAAGGMGRAHYAGAEQPAMNLVTFEDLIEGTVYEGSEVVAEREAMVGYAKQYDPWPFHVDPEAARSSPFGGLIASAGYTFSLWCRSLHGVFRSDGREWAFLGGYELRIKLLQPVRPDDRMRVRVTIVSTRPSSRPGRGHVDSVHELVRHDGVPVFRVDLGFLMATRSTP